MRASLIFALLFSLLGTAPSAVAVDDSQLSSNNSLVIVDEFLPVEEAYQLNIEFETAERLWLQWQIADGYYLYRHGFKIELLDNGKVIPLNPDIPEGLEHEDEFFGLVQVYYQQADLYLADTPDSDQLSLSVTSQGCADAGLCYPPHTQYFQLSSPALSVQPMSTAPSKAPPQTSLTEAATTSLPYMLLLALIGGAILNLMPCVFPVLSLKALAFARDKTHDHKLQGLAYTAGVVSSFILVAAILISLKSAGEAVGWGFHLQSSWFVAGLAYLFFIMGLGLSGVIEMGNSWMNLGSDLTRKPGYTGSFFTGVLATVVASPCTAPFMGTALGFAVTQSNFIALSVFAMLGLGMALPLLILSCLPALLEKIPKPGPWMETLKQFLAFPLYGTAVWLSWIVGKQAGVNAMGLILLGCTLLALALWLWNHNQVRRCLSALCAALALSMLGSSMLQANPGTDEQKNWQAYSPELLSKLRQQGKPVFLNITADWCITCLANEQLTLNTDRVRLALHEQGITYLKGDWTNHDPRITELLEDYQRTGIPLYLFFPAGDSVHGQVLPQILATDSLLATFRGETGQISE